mmetsp:Transcript_21682/g.61753  ORF Transcript_21682/g.61753 Transcript_21682/m.61753 type:complete len:1130 (+) Transcript_21682:358-3747(+)
MIPIAVTETMDPEHSRDVCGKTSIVAVMDEVAAKASQRRIFYRTFKGQKLATIAFDTVEERQAALELLDITATSHQRTRELDCGDLEVLYLGQHVSLLREQYLELRAYARNNNCEDEFMHVVHGVPFIKTDRMTIKALKHLSKWLHTRLNGEERPRGRSTDLRCRSFKAATVRCGFAEFERTVHDLLVIEKLLRHGAKRGVKYFRLHDPFFDPNRNSIRERFVETLFTIGPVWGEAACQANGLTPAPEHAEAAKKLAEVMSRISMFAHFGRRNEVDHMTSNKVAGDELEGAAQLARTLATEAAKVAQMLFNQEIPTCLPPDEKGFVLLSKPNLRKNGTAASVAPAAEAGQCPVQLTVLDLFRTDGTPAYLLQVVLAEHSCSFVRDPSRHNAMAPALKRKIEVMLRSKAEVKAIMDELDRTVSLNPHLNWQGTYTEGRIRTIHRQLKLDLELLDPENDLNDVRLRVQSQGEPTFFRAYKECGVLYDARTALGVGKDVFGHLLKKDTYFLLCMTGEMVAAAAKSKSVLTDATHNVSLYEGIKLVSFFSYDKFGYTQPLAFLITNSETSDTYQVAFAVMNRAVQQQCRERWNLSVLLTDLAPSANAGLRQLVDTVQDGPFKFDWFYCTFHTLRAVKANISHKLKTGTNRNALRARTILVFNFFREALYSTLLSEVARKLESFKTQLIEWGETQLLDYLERNYFCCVERWCLAFRAEARHMSPFGQLRTTSPLESFHSVLKFQIAGGVRIRKIGKLLSHLKTYLLSRSRITAQIARGTRRSAPKVRLLELEKLLFQAAPIVEAFDDELLAQIEAGVDELLDPTCLRTTGDPQEVSELPLESKDDDDCAGEDTGDENGHADVNGDSSDEVISESGSAQDDRRVIESRLLAGSIAAQCTNLLPADMRWLADVLLKGAEEAEFVPESSLGRKLPSRSRRKYGTLSETQEPRRSSRRLRDVPVQHKRSRSCRDVPVQLKRSATTMESLKRYREQVRRRVGAGNVPQVTIVMSDGEIASSGLAEIAKGGSSSQDHRRAPPGLPSLVDDSYQPQVNEAHGHQNAGAEVARPQTFTLDHQLTQASYISFTLPDGTAPVLAHRSGPDLRPEAAPSVDVFWPPSRGVQQQHAALFAQLHRKG